MHGEALGSMDDEGDSAGVSGNQTAKRPREEKESTEPISQVAEDSPDANIFIKNQPIMMPVYWDPTVMNNRVAVMVVLPGAADHIQFFLVGNGAGSSTARVIFDWSNTSYNIHDFFKKDIDAGNISKVDPLIFALEKELQNHRESHESSPKCVMELTLPISVQTAPNTITK